MADWWQEDPRRWVLAGALLAVVVRLPYLRAPLGADEGGFLLVASQWHAGGTSLYGSYWVDRPPLLIVFFAVADALGGAIPLRLMGWALAFSIVVLAHLLGREVTGRVSPGAPASPWPFLAAVAFVSMPITGAQEVNGELVALPLVLLGLIVALRAARRPAPDSLLLWAVTGALGTAAAMVKQNFLDVLILSVVLIVVSTSTRRPVQLRAAAGQLASLVGGSLTVGALTLFGAASRGTTPRGLWDALVVFRIDASSVIAQSASAATHDRFLHLLAMMVLSGAVAVIAMFAIHAVLHVRQALAVATLALLGWELVGVLGGGSYWSHYLLGLVPGLVLAVSQLTAQRGRLAAGARAVVGYAGLVALVTAPLALVISPPTPGDPAAAQWLEAHALPGDTATVLYGDPDILQAVGLHSPYPQLWSLPVRVLDPDLRQLRAVLNGPDAPTWLLGHSDFTTWGVSAGRADTVVATRYDYVATVDGLTVYHLATRGPAATTMKSP